MERSLSALVFSFLIFGLTNAHAEIRQVGPTLKLRTPYAPAVQGLCSDDENFFVTQRGKLWKIPHDIGWTENIESASGVKQVGIPAELKARGGNHLGDCDVFGEYIIVPLEGTTPKKLLVFDAHDLKLIAAPDLPSEMTHAPWVTVDERDGTLLISIFNPKKKDWFYRLRPAPDFSKLTVVERFQLKDEDGDFMEVPNIQAGEFRAKDGILWLLSNTSKTALLGFDLQSRKLIARQPLKTGLGGLHFNELEGLDSNDRAAWNGHEGELFVLMLRQTILHASVVLRGFDY